MKWYNQEKWSNPDTPPTDIRATIILTAVAIVLVIVCFLSIPGVL
jgi:hypothetical protein